MGYEGSAEIMTVRDLLEKLKEYNPDAIVNICVRGMPQEFEICYGGSEGCTKSTCSDVDFMVESDCDEVSQ